MMRVGWLLFVGAAWMLGACRSDYEFASNRPPPSTGSPDAADLAVPASEDLAILPPLPDADLAPPDRTPPAGEDLAKPPAPADTETARPGDVPSAMDTEKPFSDLAGSRQTCESERTCGGACGDECSVSCAEKSTCTFSAGARSTADCSEARCDFTVGDGSDVHCGEETSCAVKCLGACQVDCARSPACSVTCANGKKRDLSGATGGC